MMFRKWMAGSVTVAFVLVIGTGCGDDTSSKQPKLSGDAAQKYDMNATPPARGTGGAAAPGGGSSAAPVGKN